MNSNKQKLNLIAIVMLNITLLLTAGCQRKDSGSGGTVVGNGFIRYHDRTYDYFFDYSRELKISHISEDSIKLDNVDLANALGKRPSQMVFSVVNLSSRGLASVPDYAKQIEGSREWKPAEKSRTEGYYIQDIDSGRLNSQYIFKLGNGHALHIQANAVPEARGVALVSSVIASINFDTQAPVIHEIKFEPSKVVAGQTVKLKIRATDNMTSINGFSPAGSVARRAEQKCRQLTNINWEGVNACGEFRPLGDDWYEFDVPTNPKMKPGDYFLYPLTIWDNAGNSMELLPDIGRQVYQSRLRSDQALIPLSYLTVKNKNPDNQPPVLRNPRFEPSEISVGESAKLVFEAYDNDTDFLPNDFCERALHKDWFRFPRTDVPGSAEIDPTEYAVHACTTPKKRADGLWEVPVTTPTGLPPGEYAMDFIVKDNVGNTSTQQNTSLIVKNTQGIDTKGPTIKSVKTDKQNYKPGEKGSVIIYALDDQSGVSGQATYLRRNFCRLSLASTDIAADDNNMDERVIICDGTLRKLDENLYALDFQLPDQVPNGEYLLPEISLVDNVGNRTFLSSEKNGVKQNSYVDKYNGTPTSIPVTRVTVQN